jgi:hypothetical protein
MTSDFFFLILIIFLLTNEFYFVIKNLIKYTIFLLIIIQIVNVINPNIALYIKDTLKVLIYSDESILLIIMSNIITYIKKIFIRSTPENNVEITK